jgi:hypothetical protein
MGIVAFCWLVMVRLGSLGLETAPQGIKHQSHRREARMNTRMIVGATLETGWALGVSSLAALPAFP